MYIIDEKYASSQYILLQSFFHSSQQGFLNDESVAQHIEDIAEC